MRIDVILEKAYLERTWWKILQEFHMNPTQKN